MRRALVLLIAAGAAIGVPAPVTAAPGCCNPVCSLHWKEKPSVEVDPNSQYPVTVHPGSRPYWVC